METLASPFAAKLVEYGLAGIVIFGLGVAVVFLAREVRKAHASALASLPQVVAALTGAADAIRDNKAALENSTRAYTDNKELRQEMSRALEDFARRDDQRAEDLRRLIIERTRGGAP